jgi:ABC-2 type transport system ATP-binding protein
VQYAIETVSLRKSYGPKPAVDGIDLRVPCGSITGFLGPNGAGKTTTIRMLLGLLQRSGGRISVLGADMPKARRRIARHVGALVETPCHYDNLTARENLEITRRLLGLCATETSRVLDLMDLGPAAGQRVGTFSLGMRQRLGIARAMLGWPRLLILDEPTNGLDPDGIIEVRKFIRALSRDGTTILLSSHLLAEVEQTVDHVALIRRGKLLVQGSLREILSQTGERLLFEVDHSEGAIELLKQHEIEAAPRDGGLVEVKGQLRPPADINSLLVSNGIAVSQLVRERPSLEAAYMAFADATEPMQEAA